MEREEKIKIALARLEQIEKLIDESKKLYAERDLITMSLKQMEFTASQIGNKTFKLVDNFSDTNVCYRMAFTRRWEVKIKGAK